MTNSSTTQSSKQQTVKLSSSSRLRSWLVFIFRLLLLGVGGSFAVLLGITIAAFYPAKVSSPPLLERALRQVTAVTDTVQNVQLPWQRQPTPEAASPSAPAAPSTPGTVSPTQLNAAERQRLEAELTQIQSDLERLRNRTTAIESRLGTDTEATALAARIEAIQQQLNPADPTTGLTPSAVTGSSEALMVTLPSDSLFATNESTLQTGSQTILDNVVNELRRYPGATIRVTAHTDAANGSRNSAADRVRTFEQAKVVQQYLAGVLGDRSYHWLVIGYGDSQPLTQGTTPVDRQRNRRIEIEIDPH